MSSQSRLLPKLLEQVVSNQTRANRARKRGIQLGQDEKVTRGGSVLTQTVELSKKYAVDMDG